MFLFNITNTDYAIMTILFSIFALIAYRFRRKNNTSYKFVLNDNSFPNRIWLNLDRATFGLSEFVLLTSIGAIFGLTAFCIVLSAYIVVLLISYRFNEVNLFNLIKSRDKSCIHDRVLAIYYALFLLLVSSISVMIIVTIFKGLISWEFGNSALSLMVLVGVCMLIGGVASVFYSQLFAALVMLIVVFGVIAFGVHSIGGINQIIDNLTKIALSNGYSANHFVKIEFSLVTIKLFILAFFCCIIIVIANPWSFIRSNYSVGFTKCNFRINLLRILLVGGTLAIGVIALATPKPDLTVQDGRIVTLPQKMDDGSLGYVVKLIKNDQANIESQGLMSTILPTNNSLLSNNVEHYTFNPDKTADYDYSSAAMVLFKQLSPYVFIPLVLLVGLFYRSISETISFVTAAIINTLYVPYYNKTKDDLENLWASRVFMFMFFFVVIAIGFVLYKFLNYDFILGLLIILSIPIMVSLVVGANLFTILATFIVGVFLIITTNINDVPSVYPLISYSSWWDFCVIVPSILCVISLIITLVLNKAFHVKR